MTTLGVAFSVQVNEWVDKAEANTLAALQATATDALARVKQLTPVNTGYLRSNWQIAKAGDPLPVAGGADNSAEVIASLSIGDVIALVNPTVYAMRIEYGFVGTDSLGRHYNQPGAHMLQQTIAEMPYIAQQAADRVTALNP